jgi:hypothetical protein
MSCPRCFEGAALQVALSYVLDPRLMSTLCAVSVAFNDASYRLESWSGLVVDTPVESKPLGLKACNCHWALWKFAKAIYVRPWMFASCTFLIGSRYKPWKWLFPNVPRPFVSIRPARVVLAVALVGSPWRHCNGHWISVGSPVSPVDIRMRLGKADCIPRGFVIGMSDTCDPREIATLLCGDGEARWGLAERGPPPMQLVHLNFYNGSFHQGLVKTRWNSIELQGYQGAIATEFRDGDVISIGASSERLCLRIGGDSFEAPLATKVCSDHLYYPVLACADMDGDGPVNPGRLPIPGPLLCHKP